MDRKNKNINQRNLLSLIAIKHQMDAGAYDPEVLLQHLLVHFEDLNKEYHAVCEKYSALQISILENDQAERQEERRQ
jgi:hypothetical protein